MSISNVSSNPTVLVQLTKTKRLATGEETLEVDLNSVIEVLGNPKYKDCYVAIYAIAGPARRGKSFLLSLFCNFLQRKSTTNGFYEKFKNGAKLKKIFKWKKGPNACTKGIHILREPILIQREEKTVALFLADTQGMFDHNSSERNQTFLGTFNFLLSSFLIFNVQKGIETKHLESIYSFATNLRGSDGIFMMQKESLMFVVRDWLSVETNDDSETVDQSNDDDDGQDYGYGMDGGKTYFQDLIQNDAPNKAKEHQMMREYLENAFGENIPCCLLPYPGDAVGRKSCSLTDLNKNFCCEAFELFHKIENEKEFKIKQIQNQDCTCGELCEAVKDYVSELGPNLNVADDNSFFLQDFRVKMSRRVKNIVEEFLLLTKNQTIKNSYEDNKENLLKTKTKMMSKFKKEVGKFYPNTTMVLEWEQELDRLLSQVVKNLMTCISVENAYKTAIEKYSLWVKAFPRVQSKKNAEVFAFQARKLRWSLLQGMKQQMFQEVQEDKHLEDIFLQCKEYFEFHINKLTAAIDDDVETFLKAIKVNRKQMVSVEKFVLGPLLSSTKKSAFDLTLAANTNAAEEQVKIGADENNSNSLPGLHQYEYGEMIVKLAFGSITLKLEALDTLRYNSLQIPEVVPDSIVKLITCHFFFIFVLDVCKNYFYKYSERATLSNLVHLILKKLSTMAKILLVLIIALLYGFRKLAFFGTKLLGWLAINVLKNIIATFAVQQSELDVYNWEDV